MTTEMFLILLVISISLFCGCLIHTVFLQKKLHRNHLNHLKELCNQYDIILNLIVDDFKINLLDYSDRVEAIKKKGGEK